MNAQKDWRSLAEQDKDHFDFANNEYKLRLETSKGNILIEFFPDVAPNHCRNMLSLAKNGFYDGLSFHRIIKGFVIQGGCPHGNGTGGPGFRINAEFNEKPHEFGVLSMARAQDPHSAGSQFFICLEKVPSLDRQYSVFGRISPKDEESAATVKAIGNVETGRGDVPVERVSIFKAEVKISPRS